MAAAARRAFLGHSATGGYNAGSNQQPNHQGDGEPMSRVKEIELSQMAPLRDVSQKIAQYLHQLITAYLAPISPLLAPNRVLGEYLEGFSRDRLPGADKAYAALEENYGALCRDVFRLPSKMRSPVPAIKSRLEVYPWEYIYNLGDDAGRPVTVTCPTRWVVAYDLPYTLSDLLKAKLAGEKPQPEETKQLIINSLVLWMMMERSAAIKKLLEDLRFPITVETSSASGNMPYIVVRAAVEAFRPQDDLINMVCQLSGRPVFEELVDLEAIETVPDPLVAALKELAGGAAAG